MLQLRPDQESVYADVREAIAKHQSVLIQCATGWGKTALATVIAKGASDKRKRAIFTVHRRDLVRQTAATFNQVGLQYGYVASGLRANPFAAVQIATIGTLVNRLGRWPADLLVVDEGHLAAAPTWRRVIDHYRAMGAKILVLSATPTRLDGKSLAGIADAMVCGPSARWLMDRGLLSEYKAYAPARPDMAGLHVRAGEYVTAELTERFDKPTVIGDAIGAYRKFAMGKRTIAFAFSREHGKHLCEAYSSAGIAARYIDGETPDIDRKRCISDFADGRAYVLVGVNLFCEGFDLSAQVGREVPIEAGAFLRPTKSLALAMQMVGRCLRRKQQPAILMDHVGLFAEHGLPDDEREWSLEGSAGSKRPGEATIATCVCAQCMGIFRPAMACPHCGTVREINGRKVDIREGVLAEVDIVAMRERDIADLERRQRTSEEWHCKSLQDWEALARKRGYSPGWAWHRFNSRRKRA